MGGRNICITMHNDYAKWGAGNATLRSRRRDLRDFCIMRLLLCKSYAKLCKKLCKKLYPCIVSSSRASLFVNHLARNAMSCILRTLLLVAVMASSAGPDAGPPIQCGVTRFVCVNCSKTGKLSSRGLFLNRAAVRRHISAAKACFAADLGFSEIRVDARSGDVMAGLGGAAGPAPDVQHQCPGKQ